MLIIIDKTTKKEKRRFQSSRYPDGNIPSVKFEAKTEEVITLHDNSDIAKKILKSYDYDFVFKDGKVTDINIIKTKEQKALEDSLIPKEIKVNDELADAYEAIAMLSERVLMLEGGV